MKYSHVSFECWFLRCSVFMCHCTMKMVRWLFIWIITFVHRWSCITQIYSFVVKYFPILIQFSCFFYQTGFSTDKFLLLSVHNVCIDQIRHSRSNVNYPITYRSYHAVFLGTLQSLHKYSDATLGHTTMLDRAYTSIPKPAALSTEHSMQTHRAR